MWSKYLNNQHHQVQQQTSVISSGRVRSTAGAGFDDVSHHRQTFDLPTNGGSPATAKNDRAVRTSAVSELQDVITSFSQRELFDTEALTDTSGRSAQRRNGVTDAMQLPAAPRRPPVVEWLLTSKPTVPSKLAHDGDIRSIVATPHYQSADLADALELQRLLEALEAASPLPTQLPINNQRPISEAAEGAYRDQKGHSSGRHEPYHASVPLRRDASGGSKPLIESSENMHYQPIDASTIISALDPMDHRWSAHALGKKDVIEKPPHGKPTEPRLTSDSFARLGVIPPRTGSGESLDDGECAPQYWDEAQGPQQYIHMLDMDAVRKALQHPIPSDSSPASPHQSAPQQQQAFSTPSAAGHRHYDSHEHRLLEDFYRDPASANIAIRLQPEDKDLLQRGFHDLAKRRSACNAKAIKTRLYDAPTAPRRRAPK
jgi:hypothetical protein